MSDPVSNARSARERLAQALAALQQPGVPTALLGVAEPVAQAMSALHQIETSHGAQRLAVAPGALDAVRRSLQALQADRSGHPAVAQAIESVAGSLGLVHGLTNPAPAAAPVAAPVARPAQAAHAALGLAGTLVADGGGPGGPNTIPAQAPQAAYAAAPPAVQWQEPPKPHQQPQPVAKQPSPMAATGVLRVAAELGVHSVTNFYKGLSGNDIIDSGGIFIATYQIPPMGRELVIHVTMPGGYEFEAKGIVRWTREAPLSGSAGIEAPPGFGAQFLEITPEARQLVYRYVRNREPLFHDDL